MFRISDTCISLFIVAPARMGKGPWLLAEHRQAAAQTKKHNAHKQLQHAAEKLHLDARSQQETRAKSALAGCVQSFPNAWSENLEAYMPAHL